MACRMLSNGHILRLIRIQLVRIPHLNESEIAMTPPAPNSIDQKVDNVDAFQQRNKRERNEENYYLGSSLGGNACIAGRLLLARVLA